MLGMSQEKLGENLGITFQQIQKYEKGTNRVGASRLQAIASILGVPVAFFFEDAPGRERWRIRRLGRGQFDDLSSSISAPAPEGFSSTAPSSDRRPEGAPQDHRPGQGLAAEDEV